MFCEKCGATLVDGAKFCKSCGMRILYGGEAGQGHNINVEANINAQAQVEASASMQTQVYNTYNSNVNMAGPAMAAPAMVQGAATAANVAAGAAGKIISAKAIIAGFAAIIFLLVFGFAGYCHFMLSGPEEVVESFIDSICDMNLNAAVDCLDPSSQAQIKATLGLYNIALSIVDAPVDISAVMDLTPLFGEEMEDYKVTDAVTDYSSNEYLDRISPDFPFYNDLAKFFSDEAVVHVSLISESGDKDELDLLVKKYDGEWKIEGSNTF